jgi:hypothetical protein
MFLIITLILDCLEREAISGSDPDQGRASYFHIFYCGN